MAEKIAIVGAGVGGLATAARLAYSGYDVEVFEKLPHCGGRNQLLESGGFRFDMGPSFVMMPDFFEELFLSCNQRLEDYLDLRVIDPSYNIYYSDGGLLTIYRDSNRNKEQFEKIEKGAARAFDAFIEETGRIHDVVKPLLYDCFTAKALFKPSYWPLVGKIRALESYWGIARKYFKSEKLLFAFTFEAMFMGVSPFQAPAFYSIITWSDHVQKIAHPMGGMYQIPKAIERLARKFGAQIHYNRPVEKITGNGKINVCLKGTTVEADKVVVNADYAYACETLLGRRIPRYRYSCSVYLLYLGLKQKVSGPAHHNLFFASDLKKNLSNIFSKGGISEDSSFYVHVPTVTDSSLAPAGKDIFYILVPVPNMAVAKEDIKSHEARMRAAVFAKINRAYGIDLERLIEVEQAFYPQDFIDDYNIKNGATFGLAHNLMQSAFFRPANYDYQIKGLYYAGASTQPGGGLPVVIASSRIVADLIKKGNVS